PALVARGGAERRAVVVEAAAIPCPVPSRALERDAQPRAMLLVAGRARLVAAGLAAAQEGAQHGVEEEAHPHALALAVAAHPVHAVVPVTGAEQRQAVPPAGERSFDRAAAVLVEIGGFARAGGLEVGLVLARGELARDHERDRLAEDRAVAGARDVFGGH